MQAWTAELWKLRNDSANSKMSGIKRKGLVGYQPTRDKYKCPVDNCKAENIRGDDIQKHFQSKSNLISLNWDRISKPVTQLQFLMSFWITNWYLIQIRLIQFIFFKMDFHPCHCQIVIQWDLNVNRKPPNTKHVQIC